MMAAIFKSQQMEMLSKHTTHARGNNNIRIKKHLQLT